MRSHSGAAGYRSSTYAGRQTFGAPSTYRASGTSSVPTYSTGPGFGSSLTQSQTRSLHPTATTGADHRPLPPTNGRLGGLGGARRVDSPAATRTSRSFGSFNGTDSAAYVGASTQPDRTFPAASSTPAEPQHDSAMGSRSRTQYHTDTDGAAAVRHAVGVAPMNPPTPTGGAGRLPPVSSEGYPSSGGGSVAPPGRTRDTVYNSGRSIGPSAPAMATNLSSGPSVLHSARGPSSSGAMPAPPQTTAQQREPTGCRNMGNTCYMNAALQCILHGTGVFMRSLRATPTHEVSDMAALSSTSRRLSSSGASPLSTTAALLALTEPPVSSSSLLALKSSVSRMNNEFLGARQNDSHELIRELLHGIHRETNRVVTKPRYVEMKDIPGESDSDAFQRWSSYCKSHDDSVVYDHFGGFMRSVTKCGACGTRGFSFDPFLDLSVEVQSTLAGCFQRVNATETVPILRCEHCKQKNVKGQRQSVVVQWPQTLVLHLKRFSGSTRKDTSAVSYPPSITAEDLKGAGCVIPASAEFPSRPYRLSGIVMHHGSMGFGHYTAFVRQGRVWFECDDSSVTQVSEATVLRAHSAAYLLFYTSHEP